MTTAESGSGMPLHTRMLIGFLVGVSAGLLANFFAADAGWLDGLIRYVSDPVGQIFLRLLFMLFTLVVPLVFSALVLGMVLMSLHPLDCSGCWSPCRGGIDRCNRDV